MNTDEVLDEEIVGDNQHGRKDGEEQQNIDKSGKEVIH